MTNSTLPDGPDHEALIELIHGRWPDAVVATVDGATFFSVDESNWPNFATVVWTDAFDVGNPSDLARTGVYRLNIGLARDSYQRVVGSVREPDFRAMDQLMPHPVYAKQHWVAILNPSHDRLRETVMGLVAEAHDRLVAVRHRQAATRR